MPKNSTERLLQRATTGADRWLMGCTLLLITGLALSLSLTPPGEQAVIQRDNQTILTLPLSRNQQVEVMGRLGPVTIQVQEGQVRLLEYASARMLGTRSGWISTSGSLVACVPCGILIRVEGNSGERNQTHPFDGIAR